MRMLLALGVLTLGACGPLAATYEVDLVTTERCTVRGAEQSCETPADERETTTLIVEPRGDSVLLLLGDSLFVVDAEGPLAGERRTTHSALETGCERQRLQSLEVEVLFGAVHGRYQDSTETTGPSGRCGQTPFGESLDAELVGNEIEGP